MGKRVLVNSKGTIRDVLVFVMGLGLLAACSDNVATTTTQRDHISTTTSTNAPTTDPPEATTTTTATPPAEVAAPFPQTGASAPIWDDEIYGSDEYAALLTGLADAGAAWVTLIPTWYQEAPETSTIYAEVSGRTTTDAALETAIREARSLGLSVILKPHVDLAEGGSRLGIDPANEQEWFAAYSDMIVGYARLAERTGVEQFVVGTELAGTSDNEEAWRRVIADVRGVFSGPITYAANHDEYINVRFWDALDYVGVDAYFPLSSIPTTIISDLSSSWEDIGEGLQAVADEFDRKIVFTEIGYPSQEGATVQPFNPQFSEVVSVEEQAAALQAMLETVGQQPWFGGFHWWMWFDEDDEFRASLSYMPQGKPAGEMLQRVWREQ